MTTNALSLSRKPNSVSHHANIQAQLEIGAPNDRYEQQANAMANRVMMMSDDAPNFQLMPEKEEKVQMMPEIQSAKGEGMEASENVTQNIMQSKGQGRTMEKSMQDELGQKMGGNFSKVSIHTDNNAIQMANEVGAKAFTHGNDIYFNEGQYNPNTAGGKHLLAHELTHVMQQTNTIQRANPKWRYTPPKSVKRSIESIQGIVGTTPDGVYGPKTRDAVKRYQRILKKEKIYNKRIDGKWGNGTELGHVAMLEANSGSAMGPRRNFTNCTGFAIKDLGGFHDQQKTKDIFAKHMNHLKDPTAKTPPHHFKFWFWEVETTTMDRNTHDFTPVIKDFHVVGGQTDKHGDGPHTVMSKNGPRPVEGPKAPWEWEPRNGPAMDNDGKPIHDKMLVVISSNLKVFHTKDIPIKGTI